MSQTQVYDTGLKEDEVCAGKIPHYLYRRNHRLYQRLVDRGLVLPVVS